MESKLEKVVKDYEETVKLMEKISINEKISDEDRNVIDGVKRELRRIISKVKRKDICDDSSIINDYRSIAKKKLSDICDKVSNLTIKEACVQHLSQFQNEDMNSNIIPKQFTAADDQLPSKDIKNMNSNIIPNNNNNKKGIRRRNKRKSKQIAASAQHKQHTDDEKDVAYLRKRAELDEMATLRKYAELEVDDYKETIQLMKEILEIHKKVLADDEIGVITHAYHWIGCLKNKVNISISYTRPNNLAYGMSLIKSCRLKVENELLYVCKWMSNVMIKEIFLQHLDEFKKGPKPPKEPVAIRYFIDPSHIKELMIQKKKERADIISKEKENKYGYHDHSKCIEQQEERYYPRFVHTGDWDPISEGGIDLLYAPGRDSKKVQETFKAEYEEWREEFNIQDTSPVRPLEEEHELADFIRDDDDD